MDLRRILQQVAEGSLDIDEAERRIRTRKRDDLSWKQRLLMRAALRERRTSWMIPLIFTGLGTIFAVFGVVNLVWSWEFARRGVETDGIVTSRVFQGGPHAENSSAPIVRYKVGNKSYEFQGGNSVTPAVGQTVLVAYLPDRPSEAQIATFQQRWVQPLMFALLGSLFAIIGIVIFVGDTSK